MKSLIFDMALSTPFLLLAKDGLVQDKLLFSKEPLFSSKALNHVHEFLQKNGVTLKELSYIAVGLGPGYFTGIRSALTIAKTLNYALNIPLMTFSSLTAFTPREEGPFCIVMDAKSEMFYGQKGERNQGTITYSSPYISSASSFNEIEIKGLYSLNEGLFEKAQKGELNFETLALNLHKRAEKKEFTSHLEISPYYLKNIVSHRKS